MSKIIVTDCDGVLLDWERSFENWFVENFWPDRHPSHPQTGRWTKYDIHEVFAGLSPTHAISAIDLFEASPAVGAMLPYADSVQYVQKLVDLGYRFHVVTSIGNSDYLKEQREANLHKLFGPVFDHIECLPRYADKGGYLEKHFRNSGLLWLEDSVGHALDGHHAGLRAVLFNHGYNQGAAVPCTRVDNWKELFLRNFA